MRASAGVAREADNSHDPPNRNTASLSSHALHCALIGYRTNEIVQLSIVDLRRRYAASRCTHLEISTSWYNPERCHLRTADDVVEFSTLVACRRVNVTRVLSTLIEDAVEYALPFGSLGRLVHRFQVARDLRQIFDYRAQQVQALFPRQPGKA
jgi:hypothetical protein